MGRETGPAPSRPFGGGVLRGRNRRIADYQSGAAPLRVPVQLVRPPGETLHAAGPSCETNAGLLRGARLSGGVQRKGPSEYPYKNNLDGRVEMVFEFLQLWAVFILLYTSHLFLSFSI